MDVRSLSNVLRHEISCLVVHPYPSNKHAATTGLKALQQLAYSLKGSGAAGSAAPRTKELVELIQGSETALGFFPSDATLIPVPTSGLTVLPPNPDKWAGYRLACALHVAGLGGAVVAALTRRTVVKSSHRAAPGERPTVKNHLDSMAADARKIDTEAVVLVDDVLTTGSTAIACYLRLREAGYRGTVRVAAACFTETPPFTLPARPRLGRVTYEDGNTKAVRELD